MMNIMRNELRPLRGRHVVSPRTVHAGDSRLLARKRARSSRPAAMSDSYDFDYVVIGSGFGGSVSA